MMTTYSRNTYPRASSKIYWLCRLCKIYYLVA